MSLVRGNNYAMAGVTGAESEKFQINRSVIILDGTAGQGYDAYDDGYVSEERHSRRRNFTVSMQTAARTAGIFFAALLILLTINVIRIRKMAHDVSELENTVSTLSETNRKMDRDVLAARDLTRISYAAVQELGMIPVEEAEVYYVTAPDTRPFAVRGEAIHENAH